jgi:hypothetical protein
LRDGLGEGFVLSVTVAGDERGEALGRVVDGGTVTVRPGVVTVSDEVVVVVVVVV